MRIFKCKMCGGTLEINGNETVATCEYCGTQQTLPKLDDERRANLYDRANHFRRNNEYDKAMGIYEQILNEDSTDSEAYWSLVLCRYGIEYVEDPITHKRVPTVNRAQYTSIFDDDNYKSALQHADILQKSIYEAEAAEINNIQKGILAISQKEEPFDVFICYKETDNAGRRTPDSVLANDLYHQLTQEGFKVFFARITLEDKLGQEYEPYIFAALNSAKVMVVLGTKPEYFNAVWVKNEWSRYLALIKQGHKKMLIPAYKDMDPYDLPEEFSHLQAQDMSKLGFMQDLIRGIKKIAQEKTLKTGDAKETNSAGRDAKTEPLIKRAFMFLEDGEWANADEYCEKVLDINPECAEAYLGKLMAELQINKPEGLKSYKKRFDGSSNYSKAIRFADDKLKETLEGYLNAALERQYVSAKKLMQKGETERELKRAALAFNSIIEYKDSAELIKKCNKKVEEMNLERSNAEKKKKAKSRKKKIIITASVFLSIVLIVFGIAGVQTIKYNIKSNEENYSEAMKYLKKENIADAYDTFIDARKYKDSREQANKICEANRLGNVKNLKPGDAVFFGSYEQDNKDSNGPETIAWNVLDVKNGKALLISNAVLDGCSLDQISGYWNECDLHTWLTNDFYNSAFTDEEKERIQTTKIYDKDADAYTKDKVFLLSINEAYKYLYGKNHLFAIATDYANIEKEISYYYSSETKKLNELGSVWVLRTYGASDYAGALGLVDYEGVIMSTNYHYENFGVRPAMWVSIK